MKHRTKKRWYSLILALIIVFGTVAPTLAAVTNQKDYGDLDGVWINVEDANGDPLQSGSVQVYDRRYSDNFVWDNSPYYWYNLIYRNQVVDGWSFIPNAYLLEGREYDIVIEGVGDDHGLLYHQVVKPENISELHFLATTLTEVTFSTGNPYASINVSFASAFEAHTFYYWFHADQGGEKTIYASSELDLSYSYTYGDKQQDVGYVFQGLISLEDELVTISNETNNLVKVTVENGHKLASNSGFYSTLYVSKGFDNWISILVEEENTSYIVGNYGSQINEDVILKVGNSFSALYFDDYWLNRSIPGNKVSLYITYADEYGNYLSDVRIGEQSNSLTMDGKFYAVNSEGSVALFEAQNSEFGTQFVEVNHWDLQSFYPSYELFKIEDENRDLIEIVNSTNLYYIDLVIPTEPGLYSLEVIEPTELAISFDFAYEFIVGNANTNEKITIEIPDGYDVMNSSMNRVTLSEEIVIPSKTYFSQRGTEFLYQNTSFALQPHWNVKEDQNYLVTFNFELRNKQTLETVIFAREIFVSGADLLAGKQITFDQLKEVSVRLPLEFTNFNVSYHFTDYINFTTNLTSRNIKLLTDSNKIAAKIEGIASGKGYSLIEFVSIEDDRTEVSFDKALQEAVNVQFKNNEKVIPLDSLVILGFGNWFLWFSGSIESLYVTPGQQNIMFNYRQEYENDTPWLTTWETKHQLIEEDTVFQFKEGTITSKHISQLDVYHNNSYLATNISIKSGDVHLQRVAVFREWNATSLRNNSYDLLEEEIITETTVENDFGVEETLMTVGSNNNFTQRQDVHATITITEKATNQIKVKNDNSFWANSWYNLNGYSPGTYNFHFTLPLGPKERIVLEREFIIGGEGLQFVSLTEPQAGAFTNDSNLIVSGNASVGAEVTVYALYEGTGVEKVEVATIATDGSFSVPLELAVDGVYTVGAYINQDIKASERKITLDTVPPSVPNIEVTQQGNELTITWQEDSDAFYYEVYGAIAGEQLQLLKGNYKQTSYTLANVQVGQTYTFKVVAYDRAGNSSMSEVVEFSTADYAISELSVHFYESAYKLLILDSELEIEVDGSYQDGTYATAEIDVIVDGNLITETVELSVESSSEDLATFVGFYQLTEGITDVIEVRAWLTNASGEDTDVVSVQMNKSVGATVVIKNITNANEKTSVELRRTNGRVFATGQVVDGVATFEGLPVVSLDAFVLHSTHIYNVGKVNPTLGKKSVLTFTVNLPELVTVILNVDGLDTVDWVSFYNYNLFDQYGHDGAYYYRWNVPVKDGKIEIPNRVIADGYELRVGKDGYVTYIQGNVNVTAENHTFSVDLSQGMTVTGTVLDENNLVIPNANVNIIGENNMFAYARTNANGKFTVRGVPEGNFVVSVQLQGYKSFNGTFTPEEAEGLQIKLEESNYVEGQLLNSDYSPASRLWVYLLNEHGHYVGWTRANELGEFRFNNLQDDQINYKISVGSFPFFTGIKAKQYATLVLRAAGEGNFAGTGNFLEAMTQVVTPGGEIEYKLNYFNEGSNVDLVTIDLHADGVISFTSDSVDIIDNKITLENLEDGDNGEITFKATVKENVTRPIVTSATFTVGEFSSVVDARTDLLFVTLQAPAATSSGKVVVNGLAMPGAVLTIFEAIEEGDDVLLGTITPVTNRQWNKSIDLTVEPTVDSVHQLYAVVELGEHRFVSNLAEVEYNDETPMIQSFTYSVWGEEFTINPYEAIPRRAIMEFSEIRAEVTFTGDVDSAAVHFVGKQANLTKRQGQKFNGLVVDSSWSSAGNQLFELVYSVNGKEIRVPLMEVIVLIDPAGFVFEGTMSNRLEGVTAIVQYRNDTGNWVNWDAENYNQVNPQVTGEDGRYRWDVPEGDWRVLFSKEGYDAYTSRIVVVPPPETELNVPLIKTSLPELLESSIIDNAGDVALDHSFTFTFDRYMDVTNQGDIFKLVKVVEDADDVLVDITFTNETKAGYKGEEGFYEADETKRVSEVVSFTSQLEANTVYKVIINDDIFVDYAGKFLKDDTYEFMFTTASEANQEPGDGDGGNEPVVPTPPASPISPTPISNIVEISKADLERLVKQNKASIELSSNQTVVQLSKAAYDLLLEKQYTVEVKQGDIILSFTSDLVKVTNDTKSIKIEVKEENATYPGGFTKASKQVAVNITLIDHAGKDTVLKDGVYKLALPLSKNVSAELVGAYVVANGQPQYLGKLKNDGSFTANVLGSLVLLVFGIDFADTKNHWGKEHINFLVAHHVVNGKSSTRFAPNEEVTRAEFAKMMVELLGYQVNETKTAFTDINEKAWHAKYINAAVREGIFKGDGTTFRPDAPISREEMAVVIARVLGKTSTKGLAFADSQNIAPWAVSSIAIAVEFEIINGKSNNKFDPKANATRAEAAAMLHRLSKVK